ncbi:hypothetical protein TKK_0004044 [Trichogramma kaykai]
MSRIIGDGNAELREIATSRKRDLGRVPQVIGVNTQVCLSCRQSIRDEIALLQDDPRCMKPKPTLVVAPDGYILDIQGPYFSDEHNNDAATLPHELENDENLNNWFRPGDIVVVDRGYRDVIDTLEGLGLVCKISPTPEPGQRQLTTEDANEIRLITKTRWIVEARNGHLKGIFELLNQTQQIHVLPNIGDFVRIGGVKLTVKIKL